MFINFGSLIGYDRNFKLFNRISVNKYKVRCFVIFFVYLFFKNFNFKIIYMYKYIFLKIIKVKSKILLFYNIFIFWMIRIMRKKLIGYKL